MRLIAAAIVPFWESLEPAAFALWFRDHASLLGRIMIPLGVGATLLSVLAAALARPISSPGFRWWAVAAGLALGVAAVYPLYFSAANAALAGGSLEPAQIADELERWRVWHQARTAAGIAGFLAALRALSIRPVTYGG